MVQIAPDASRLQPVRSCAAWPGVLRRIEPILDPNPDWVLVAAVHGARTDVAISAAAIPVGHSNWPGFQQVFEERTNEGIERYLLPHETIEEFYALALQPGVFMLSDLSRMPCERGTVLAALGQFDEATELLTGSVAELERNAAAEIERGQALLAKRSNSGVGTQDVEFGERKRKLAGELHRLLRCLRESATPLPRRRCCASGSG